jgi:hypothetical protein
MIDFPKYSRSYDASRHAVRFWGYDSAIEASFFIDEDALARIQPGIRPDDSGSFDANRDKICAGAARVYLRGSRGFYGLARPTFETVGLNLLRRGLHQSRPSAICRRRSRRRRRSQECATPSSPWSLMCAAHARRNLSGYLNRPPTTPPIRPPGPPPPPLRWRAPPLPRRRAGWSLSGLSLLLTLACAAEAISVASA